MITNFLHTLIQPTQPPIILILVILYVSLMLITQIILDYRRFKHKPNDFTVSKGKHHKFTFSLHRPDPDAESIFINAASGWGDLLGINTVRFIYSYLILKFIYFQQNIIMIIFLLIILAAYQATKVISNENKKQRLLYLSLLWVIVITAYWIGILL